MASEPLTSNGRRLWLEQLEAAVRPDGTIDLARLGALVGAAFERADAELAQKGALLAQLEKSMQAMLDNVDQGIVMSDADGGVPICNRRAVELLGLPPALMERRPHSDDIVGHQVGAGEFGEELESVRARVEAAKSL